MLYSNLRQFAADEFHLLFVDVLASVFAEVEERVEHGAVKARVFAGALHFDEVLGILHHDVHVDVGGGVFDIAEVAKRVAAYDAHGNGGDAVLQDLLSDAEAFLDFLEREGKGHEAADDARGTRASVGFDHVAVDHDGVLAEGCKVGCAAQRTAYQALDFLRATAGAFAFAFYALARALREQTVFSRNPARAATGEPVRNFREERCVADDAGASHFDEDGTIGTGDESGGHLEIAVFFWFSVCTCVSHGNKIVVSKQWLVVGEPVEPWARSRSSL